MNPEVLENHEITMEIGKGHENYSIAWYAPSDVRLQPGEVQIGKFRIDQMYAQITALQARVVELETILLYAPGGSGMLAAKEHFESLQQTPK